MGWRTKFVFLLIVYAAGFATAVYWLAPTPQQESGPQWTVAQLGSTLKSQAILESFNSGMHKCVGFSRDAVKEVAKLIATKMNETESQARK